MRRSFSGARAALVGVAVVLAAGGGYALAKGHGKGEVTACVHRHGRGLYMGSCAKHDRKLSWSKVGPVGPVGPPGPQGPGTTKLVYDAGGSHSGALTSIGSMGPYRVSARCTQPIAGTTKLDVLISGPGGRLDGVGDGGTAVSGAFPPPSNTNLFPTLTSTSTSPDNVADSILWIPTSGVSVQTLLTAQAAGGSINSCHFSAAITPTS